MKSIKSTIIVLILTLLSFFLHSEVYSAHSYSDLENQIEASSSASSIMKLQSFFKELGLYGGSIDGQYSSIEGNLLSYQKKAGIITHDSDWGAGYFGVQTLTALEKDYPNEFKNASQILRIDQPDTGERYFWVTAYYSPVPNQERYSYNVYTKKYRTYEEEKRLQGEGHTGASGKAVFSGMLAAPKNYAFGTKIELEGIGIGDVQDRGGAIVSTGERGYDSDRIDIWMGYGDEGLSRAKKWGKRKVKGQIVSSSLPVSIQFNDFPIEQYASLKVDLDSNDKQSVVKLQKLLKDLDIYKGSIDGNYESVKKDFINFQVKNKIVKSSNSDDAGYFGPKTVAFLREKYQTNSIFENPKLAYDGMLTDAQKSKLKVINTRISKFIDTKSKGNTVIQVKYEKTLKDQLSKLIGKAKTETRKAQLMFIMNNI